MKTLKCKYCSERKPRNEFKFYDNGYSNQKCSTCASKPVKKGKPFSGKVCICCKERKDSQKDFGRTEKGTVQLKCLSCMVPKVITRTCICCNKTKERDANFKRYVSRIFSKKCITCTETPKVKVLKVKKSKESKVNPLTYEAKQLEKMDALQVLQKVKEKESKLKFERVVREGLNYKGAIILKKI